MVKWRSLGSGDDRRSIPISPSSGLSQPVQPSTPTIYDVPDAFSEEVIQNVTDINVSLSTYVSMEAIIRAKILRQLASALGTGNDSEAAYEEFEDLMTHLFNRLAAFQNRMNNVVKNAPKTGINVPSLQNDLSVLIKQFQEVQSYISFFAQTNESLVNTMESQEQILSGLIDIQTKLGGIENAPPPSGRRSPRDWTHKPKRHIIDIILLKDEKQKLKAKAAAERKAEQTYPGWNEALESEAPEPEPGQIIQVGPQMYPPESGGEPQPQKNVTPVTKLKKLIPFSGLILHRKKQDEEMNSYLGYPEYSGSNDGEIMDE